MQDCRILLIDDNEDTCWMVSVALGLKGYKVTYAHTVAEALTLAKGEPFNLFLLDNKLPDGSGVDLCHQIREFDRRTPVLFFSAAAYDSDKKKAMEAGAQGYVTKPSDPETLQDSVTWLISGKGERVELW